MNKSNQYKLLILICLETNSMNHSGIHKLLKKLNSIYEINLFWILKQSNKFVALRDHNYSIWGNAKFCSENLSLEAESAHPRYQVHQFSGKTDDFDFLIPNLPKKRFWGRNFKLVSLDLESAPSIYHECQFSGKKNNFKFSGLNLGVLPNYVRYFGSYNVEGVV